ncbi:MAG TPA: nucleoside hydrolase [bacterium]|nr:nucleoside hydrolase [bacterium]
MSSVTLGGLGAPGASPRRVIIDTDPGIDDGQAILFALLCGRFEIDAVTSVFGNVRAELAAANVLRLMDLAGRSNLPVYVGATEPLVQRRLFFAPTVHGANGFGSVQLPLPDRTPEAGYAAVELAQRAVEAPGKITLLCLGPLTNVALAMRLEPGFAGAVKEIIFMGGIVRGPGNVSAVATANILNDPEAAKVVLGAGIQLTMVGQDVTRWVRVSAARRERMRTAGSRIAEFIYQITGFYADAYTSEGIPGFPVHDLLVMAYALRPGLFETQQLPVDVDIESSLTRGMTVADFRPQTDKPANVRVCMKADADGILDWYEQVIASAP